MKSPCFSRITGLFALLLLTADASGQYYDNRVLEKGFETSDFFFTPFFVNPFGLEGFGPATAGLFSDPLLDLQLSPSLVSADSASGTYAYLDFRNSRERRNPAYDYILYPAMDQRGQTDAMIAPPWPYTQHQRLAEPVLSAAFFFRPSGLPRLTVGATYSVTTNDQAYYAVPEDIYRNAPGLDFSGNPSLEGDIPITDVYAGSDQMHQLGHFPTVFASWQFRPTWRIGLKASFVRFDRDGELGDSYNQPPSHSSPVSRWSQFETRNQDYRHTDVALGLDGALSAEVQVGGSLGILRGTSTQLEERTNAYRYAWEQDQNTVYSGQSDYWADGERKASWEREGSTVYATAFVRRRLDVQRILTASYRIMSQSVDLSSAMTLSDSSYSLGSSRGPDYSYRYENRSHLSDLRSGTGTMSGTSHRLSVGLEWTLGPSSQFTLGVVGTHGRTTSESSEGVSSDRYLFYDNQWNMNRDGYEAETVEEKTLDWRMTNRQSSLQVPLVLRQHITSHVELMVGVVRSMNDQRLADETLALYDLQHRMENDRLTVRRDFGERYREPTLYRTDITTTGLLGVTVRPSPDVDIRLLMAPQWAGEYRNRRTQWWLGFQFRP